MTTKPGAGLGSFVGSIWKATMLLMGYRGRVCPGCLTFHDCEDTVLDPISLCVWYIAIVLELSAGTDSPVDHPSLAIV
jgi:hypothetical protein